MEENKNFNKLLIEILKQIHTRLDRLDAKIDTKTYKKNVSSLEKQLDRIETNIKAFTWVMVIEGVIIIIILALLEAY